MPPDGEHRETVVDFLELVRTGQPAHGRHVLTRSAVVDACYASAEAGHEVALPVSERRLDTVSVTFFRNSGASS